MALKCCLNAKGSDWIILCHGFSVGAVCVCNKLFKLSVILLRRNTCFICLPDERNIKTIFTSSLKRDKKRDTFVCNLADIMLWFRSFYRRWYNAGVVHQRHVMTTKLQEIRFLVTRVILKEWYSSGQQETWGLYILDSTSGCLMWFDVRDCVRELKAMSSGMWIMSAMHMCVDI